MRWRMCGSPACTATSARRAISRPFWARSTRLHRAGWIDIVAHAGGARLGPARPRQSPGPIRPSAACWCARAGSWGGGATAAGRAAACGDGWRSTWPARRRRGADGVCDAGAVQRITGKTAPCADALVEAGVSAGHGGRAAIRIRRVNGRGHRAAARGGDRGGDRRARPWRRRSSSSGSCTRVRAWGGRW